VRERFGCAFGRFGGTQAHRGWSDMEEIGTTDLGLMIAATAAGVGISVTGCCFWLRREAERINSLWDDIYFRLRERGQLVGKLNERLRVVLRTNPKLVEDIQYLLHRMEETNDPHTHAAVQNSLVLTVQTAVEQFHRDAKFRLDSELTKVMESIRVVDSRLAPMRDRYNGSVHTHNKRVNSFPTSVAGKLSRARERTLFPMLIPWWSTEAAAYGAITSDDIRHQLQTWKAPLILVPSQRAQWPGGGPGGARVVHIPQTSSASPSGTQKPMPSSGPTGEPHR
jgi:hypothetical protein